jgi:hypothetical protein
VDSSSSITSKDQRRIEGNAEEGRIPSSKGVSILDASFRQATPLLVQEGWTRHPERCREATFDGADGVVSSAQSLTLTEKHFEVTKVPN